MKQITEITSDARQKHTLVFENGDSCTFELYYLPRLEQWFFNIEHTNLTLNGATITTGSLLRQYKNLIDFDIVVTMINNLDPFLIDDFESERAKLYLLTETERDEFGELVYGE